MSKETAMAQLTGESPGLAVAEAPKETPKDVDSTRFAHLAKKEADFVRQREEFKKERELVQAEKEKMKSIHERLTQFEEMKTKDPIAALKLAGFSETDLFNFMAQAEDTSTPEERATKAAQAEIKKFQDEMTKKEQEAKQKQNDEVIQNFKQDISKHVASDKKKYKYVNHNGPLAEELIYSTVEAVLADSKEIISVSEAAEMVEDYYKTAYEELKSLEEPAPEVVAPTKTDTPLRAEVAPRPKTLSNNVTASVASTIKRRETPGEKRERLIEALRTGSRV